MPSDIRINFIVREYGLKEETTLGDSNGEKNPGRRPW
jgi:hypothetical protein